MTWLYSDQWAAGFFDGEGCISIHRRQRGGSCYYQLTAQLTQNDVRPLQEVQRRFGGTISKPRTNSGDRCHRWRAVTADAERFLRSILPHLLVKRQAAEDALKIRDLTGYRELVTAENQQARAMAYDNFRRHFAR